MRFRNNLAREVLLSEGSICSPFQGSCREATEGFPGRTVSADRSFA